MFFRVGAEFGEHDVVIGAARDFEKAVFPEAVEVRDGRLIGPQLLAPASVEMSEPTDLVAALRIGVLAAETARKRGEDRTIAACLADRRDRLLHGDDETVAVGGPDVVA